MSPNWRTGGHYSDDDEDDDEMSVVDVDGIM